MRNRSDETRLLEGNVLQESNVSTARSGKQCSQNGSVIQVNMYHYSLIFHMTLTPLQTRQRIRQKILLPKPRGELLLHHHLLLLLLLTDLMPTRQAVLPQTDLSAKLLGHIL